MVPSTPPQRELLMVGMSAKTYRIGKTVRKECHVLVDDMGITKQNKEACKNEADVYLILGSHPLIAKCLSIGPEKEYIELEYYPNGNLKEYVQTNCTRITETDLKLRHSDFRLDQWLVDANLNARLSDFNASGFDDQPDLGLKGKPAQGLEILSHYLPRDPEADNTVESDLFAMGSTLYELLAGQTPYEGLSGELIDTEGLLLGDIIIGCWEKKISSAKDILYYGKDVFRSKETKEADKTGERKDV
ncbi:hypothetical protein BU23DRAFT_559154 [Bimuria novae-zelandiae CBS 107.79]|uniref:Protein kinase domain-containing protein n=1 Tax=Bimuria novae-zelandiae CBS 107.79 TaxID=1447943 RepID=A0A6A5URU3_9PLEO|nr:hypothetical protein BU23DRAFT_559154 [Bimuria novae-zelandiae CBS 107.79]